MLKNDILEQRAHLIALFLEKERQLSLTFSYLFQEYPICSTKGMSIYCSVFPQTFFALKDENLSVSKAYYQRSVNFYDWPLEAIDDLLALWIGHIRMVTSRL